MHEPPDKSVSARSMRGAIVVSTYHSEITSQLEHDAVDAWIDAGGVMDDLRIVHVAGAFELPVACAAATQWEPGVDIIVALGCVIKGETTHDQHINTAVATGLSRVAIDSLTPVAMGVLTCGSLAQAKARCDGTRGRKGTEAMHAALTAARAMRMASTEHAG